MIASSAIRSDFLTELRQFRYFVEIARRGSFTAASRTLHITQSALSEQIMRLERELDCRLFDRGRHGAKVTVAGERLLGRAEELLRVSNEIDRSIGHFGRPRTETLRIGMTMSPAISWFPSVIAELERDSGALEVTVVDITTAEIYLEVSTGALDLGVISTSDPVVTRTGKTGLVVTRLYEDEFVVLMPAAHRLAKRQVIALTEISEERLIAFPRSFTLRVVTDALLVREGASTTPSIETGWLEMALSCVQAGLGVLVTPRSTLVHPGAEGVVAVGIDAAVPATRTLAALHRPDAPLLPVILDLLGRTEARLEAARLR